MYFADMNSFGFDRDCVGVTGIAGCMGIFVATDDLLYAIHVKAQNATAELLGAQKFGAFVKRCENPGKVAQASVWCVVNGGNRIFLRDDLTPFATNLGVKRITAVRMFGNIDARIKTNDWSGLASIAVAFTRGDKKGAFIIRYQQDSKVDWRKGEQAGGRYRDGWYVNPSSNGVSSVDPNFPGWHTVIGGKGGNSTFENLNF